MTSKIGWTDRTWNPITGCTPVSEACTNCYASAMAKRFWKGRPFSDIRFHPERLGEPSKWKKPQRVFVCSMSDLFHEKVETDWICKIFHVMAGLPWHTFILLTKRPERMEKKSRV